MPEFVNLTGGQSNTCLCCFTRWSGEYIFQWSRTFRLLRLPPGPMFTCSLAPGGYGLWPLSVVGVVSRCCFGCGLRRVWMLVLPSMIYGCELKVVWVWSWQLGIALLDVIRICYVIASVLVMFSPSTCTCSCILSVRAWLEPPSTTKCVTPCL